MVIRIPKMHPKCRNLTLVDSWKLEEFKIWLLVQHECFSSEIISLKKTMMVESKNNLIGFLPILDNDGIKRSKGGQPRTDVEYQTKYPIILYSQHWAVKLFYKKCTKHGIMRVLRIWEALSNKIFDSWFLVWGLLYDLWSMIVSNGRNWHEQWFLKYQTYQQADWKQCFFLSVTGVDHFGQFQLKHFRSQWTSGFVCSRVSELEPSTSKLCGLWTCKVV